jgi:hypothetical protein
VVGLLRFPVGPDEVLKETNPDACWVVLRLFAGGAGCKMAPSTHPATMPTTIVGRNSCNHAAVFMSIWSL